MTVATMEQVSSWINDGIFKVISDEVYKCAKGKLDKKLSTRINHRNRCTHGDLRVDLCHQGLRRSLHVSQVIWMYHTKCCIPKGFEVHHIDEDHENNDFNNLLLVHAIDHAKLHKIFNSQLEEVPF